MTTYIVDTHMYPTKKSFKAAITAGHSPVLRDLSMSPGALSGPAQQLFKWGIRYMTVTNGKRSWFAEVSQGRNGQPVVK